MSPRHQSSEFVMRSDKSLPALAMSLVAGLAMILFILLSPGVAFADSGAAVSTSPGPALRLPLDDADEIAALDAISIALAQVGDGQSYVWHRNHGRLSGVVSPTSSFKDQSGQVCRHFVTLMISGARSSRLETIACRLPDGRWQLDG
ncbi:MAG: hypothetical protein KGP27_03765 [Hyphomicrobiales bacterium]|nr:hypothetical protein [Hyphomicrobiales bacterium]